MNRSIQYILGLILGILIFTSCLLNPQNRSAKNSDPVDLSFADSVWMCFRDSMKTHQIDYLIGNSLDTIQCIDCLADSLKTDNEYYNSKFIFTQHLSEFMHLDHMETHDFTTYFNDTLMYVSYSIRSKYAEEGAYGLHYRFKKVGGKYLLQSMFTIP